MKPLPWARSALALCVVGTLTACGGGGVNENNDGDVVVTPPPESSSSSSGGSSSGGAEGPILSENFGDNLFVNFNEADTQFFFSLEYKALDSNNAEDAFPSFYYPTCCFFANDKPVDGPEVALDQLGIVSDNGNPSMLLNTGRFTAGQARPDIDDTDPKKDTTTSDDVASWGELDLSQPYRISFCVKEVSGTRNMQVYVDNNTSGEANSVWGGGSQGSRIFNVPASDLLPGKRVQINVPGDITYEQGGEVKDVRPGQVGMEGSFLQFRVEGGSSVIFDDLLVERQEDDTQADLPACTVFEPAAAPAAPDAPSLFATDAQIVVSWSSSLGAISYDLAYGTGADVNAATKVEGLTETSTTLTELDNGSTYSVWVRAVNNVDAGDWSEAAMATPEAPVGDNCTPTTTVNPSADNSILWNVYDGCMHPGELGAVVINGSEATNFTFGDDELPWFTVSDLGIMNLDTRAGDGDTKPVGDLDGIVTTGAYPIHFTWIARIDNSLIAGGSERGFEVETHIDGRRLKAVLRPDSDKVQLEKFAAGDSTVEVAGVDFTGGYHTYQFSFTVNNPAADSDNINAIIYRDGVEVGNFTGPGRSGGSDSRLRIGEGSGSAFYADVDWIVWSDNATAASLTPANLVGELPADIGELGAYAGADANVILSENFDAATDGDGSASSLFTAAYMSVSGNDTLPFFNANNGSSRVSVSGGALSYQNARFTLGDPTGGDKTTTAGDTTTRGDLDLSQPYRISFDVVTNNNADDGDGECQVYVDNDGTSSGNSFHGGDSKIFASPVLEMSSGSPTGPVVIESNIGTDTSFIQFRCDSKADTGITIDNLVIEYQ